MMSFSSSPSTLWVVVAWLVAIAYTTFQIGSGGSVEAAAAAPWMRIPLPSSLSSNSATTVVDATSIDPTSRRRRSRLLYDGGCHDQQQQHQGTNLQKSPLYFHTRWSTPWRLPTKGHYNSCTDARTTTTRTRTAWIFPPSVTGVDPSASMIVGGGAGGGFSFVPAPLWLLRGASALLTYAGCVAYWDRPRGGEHIVLPSSTTTTTATTIPPSASCLQVAPSSVSGAGLGLFVTQRLDRGTRLGYYPGVVLPLAPHVQKLQTAPQFEAYIWRFSDQQMVIDPTNERGELEATCRGGNPTTLGSTWLFATLLAFWQVPSTLCRINEPPLGRDVNVITVEDVEQRQVALVLERDVYPGEELFMDYGRDYDRSRYARVETARDDTVTMGGVDPPSTLAL